MERYDLVIVGSGPAGSSTALHLLRRNPAWATRILILEKERHPRHKLCGGGLTEWGARPLAHLGLTPPAPHVPVQSVRFGFAGQAVTVRRPDIFRVYRRDEFDDWLCQRVKDAGVAVREGAAVTDLRRTPDGISVDTTAGPLQARVLVGADGSKSLARRKLGLGARADHPGAGGGGVARLLEVLTPEEAATTPEFVEGSALFDFTPLGAGVQGYYWDFPSLVRGRAFMNRGVYDSRANAHAPRPALKAVLAAQLARRARALDETALQGHPIHWFTPWARLAGPHAILVGDAAGVDPLFGEGIGYALHYGRVAAAAIAAAFARQDFSFADYRRRVLADWVGRDLCLRALAAGLAYRLMGWQTLAALTMWTLRLAVPLVPWANQGARPNPPTVRESAGAWQSETNLDTTGLPR